MEDIPSNDASEEAELVKGAQPESGFRADAEKEQGEGIFSAADDSESASEDVAENGLTAEEARHIVKEQQSADEDVEITEESNERPDPTVEVEAVAEPSSGQINAENLISDSSSAQQPFQFAVPALPKLKLEPVQDFLGLAPGHNEPGEDEAVTTPRLAPILSPSLPLVSPLVAKSGVATGYFPTPKNPISSELEASALISTDKHLSDYADQALTVPEDEAHSPNAEPIAQPLPTDNEVAADIADSPASDKQELGSGSLGEAPSPEDDLEEDGHGDDKYASGEDASSEEEPADATAQSLSHETLHISRDAQSSEEEEEDLDETADNADFEMSGEDSQAGMEQKADIGPEDLEESSAEDELDQDDITAAVTDHVGTDFDESEEEEEVYADDDEDEDEDESEEEEEEEEDEVQTPSVNAIPSQAIEIIDLDDESDAEGDELEDQEPEPLHEEDSDPDADAEPEYMEEDIVDEDETSSAGEEMAEATTAHDPTIESDAELGSAEGSVIHRPRAESADSFEKFESESDVGQPDLLESEIIGPGVAQSEMWSVEDEEELASGARDNIPNQATALQAVEEPQFDVIGIREPADTEEIAVHDTLQAVQEAASHLASDTFDYSSAEYPDQHTSLSTLEHHDLAQPPYDSALGAESGLCAPTETMTMEEMAEEELDNISIPSIPPLDPALFAQPEPEQPITIKEEDTAGLSAPSRPEEVEEVLEEKHPSIDLPGLVGMEVGQSIEDGHVSSPDEDDDAVEPSIEQDEASQHSVEQNEESQQLETPLATQDIEANYIVEQPEVTQTEVVDLTEIDDSILPTPEPTQPESELSITQEQPAPVTPSPASRRPRPAKRLSGWLPNFVSTWFTPQKRSQEELSAQDEDANPTENLADEQMDLDSQLDIEEKDEVANAVPVEPKAPVRTPRKRKEKSVETPRRVTRSMETDDDQLPFKTPAKLIKSLSTSLSYFTPLSNLSSYFRSQIDVIAIVANTPLDHSRANIIPKDFFLTFQITDATTIGATRLAQIFRPYEAALPKVKRGDVVLLRDLKVGIRDGLPYLTSANCSSAAWAVFSFKSPNHDPEVAISGPQVEYSSQETTHIKDLHTWWLAAGHKKIIELDTPPLNSLATPARKPRKRKAEDSPPNSPTAPTTSEQVNVDAEAPRSAKRTRHSFPAGDLRKPQLRINSGTTTGLGSRRNSSTSASSLSSPAVRRATMSPSSGRGSPRSAASGGRRVVSGGHGTTLHELRNGFRYTSSPDRDGIHRLRDGFMYMND